MSRRQALRRWNARVDGWFDEHPVVEFVALALAPLVAIVALEWVQGGNLHGALVRGLVFGLTLATVTLVLRRRFR